ncbi:MAG: CBS domain-containing protein [Candidatus Methanomethylophilaceae archaeon]|nr:CBS domain-containing protein [Candidatus Methanomethylophilaceae archaeon]MDD3378721.1 CBS domain-containing protein [Candidatus Methanomethylophilaceae archaeon]
MMKALRVRDLMTTQVVTVRPTDTLRQATIKFAVDNITGAPVVDNRNHIVGMITENDVLELILKYQEKLQSDTTFHNLLAIPMDGEIADEKVAQANKAISDMTVETIMTRSILTTTPDAEIVEALKVMMKLNVNRIPVLEQGILVGTISRSDIIFYIYKKKV